MTPRPAGWCLRNAVSAKRTADFEPNTIQPRKLYRSLES